MSHAAPPIRTQTNTAAVGNALQKALFAGLAGKPKAPVAPVAEAAAPVTPSISDRWSEGAGADPWDDDGAPAASSAPTVVDPAQLRPRPRAQAPTPPPQVTEALPAPLIAHPTAVPIRAMSAANAAALGLQPPARPAPSAPAAKPEGKMTLRELVESRQARTKPKPKAAPVEEAADPAEARAAIGSAYGSHNYGKAVTGASDDHVKMTASILGLRQKR